VKYHKRRKKEVNVIFLIKDSCSSIIGGESFNTIYATILKKVNFGGKPLQ
jgi:hypothetical protein